MWIISILILLLLGINIISLLHQPNQPQAEHGVLHLRGMNLPKQEIIRLSGEWEFYPDQFITRQEELEQAESFNIVSVPGNWNSSHNLSSFDQALGYGTYRLKVNLDRDHAKLLGLRMPLIRSAHRVFINGEEIGSKGIVSTNRENYIPQVRPYIAVKEMTLDSFDIFVQVSNFDYKTSGGIINPIQMGPLDVVMKAHQRIEAFDFGMIAVFMLLAMFFLLMHMKVKWNHWLYLAVFFFCTALMTANQGSKWMYELFPNMTYRWGVNFYWMATVGLTTSIFMFIYKQHLKSISVWFVRALNFVSCLLMVFVFMAPMTFVSSIIPIWLFCAVVVYCYMIIVLSRSLRSEDEHEKYTFIAFCLFSASSFLNMFNQLGIGETSLLFFLQVIGFSIAFSLIILNQFFRSYRQTHELSLRLKRVDRMKNDFMANLSAQMVVPLNAVNSIIEARIQSDNRLTVDQRQELRLVNALGWTMKRMVEDLLDFSRLRDEGIVLNVRPLDLQMVIEEVIERLEFLIFTNSVRIHNKMTNKVLPPVLADEQRLSQILTALISHAIKLTFDGTIKMDAEADEQMIEMKITMHGNRIATIIESNQIQSWNEDTNENDYINDGVNIGLTLVKSLVELHGGKLTIAANSSDEACFIISLPTARGASEQTDSSAALHLTYPVYHMSNEAMNWSTMNSERAAIRKLEFAKEIGEAQVLIIDDDNLSLKMLSTVLALDGYHVIAKRNGKDALFHLQTQGRVDLIIVNRTLPDISGIEVCRQIRIQYNLFELPILLLTNARHSEHAVIASQAGANDFLEKPIESSELRVRIRTLLQLKHSVGERIQMELAFLQAQIKPHFLFNTLNSIVALSKRQPDTMAQLLSDFGDYLRESFRFDNSEPLIAFERELKLVKSYLHIEKVRFEDWLNYDISNHTDTKFKIPPLTLQPLVENAVRHGIMRRANGGKIQIQIWQEEYDICIQVSDNGIGMTQEVAEKILHSSPSGGLGIRNIDRRLKQMFGKGLVINSKLDQGTDIFIRLPIEKVGYDESNRRG